MSIMFTLIIWHVSRTNQSLRQLDRKLAFEIYILVLKERSQDKGMFVFNYYINCLFFIVWPRCKPNWYNLFQVSVSVSMNKLQNYQIFIARLHGVSCNNSSVTGGSCAKFYVVRLPVDHECLEHSLALMSAK